MRIWNLAALLLIVLFSIGCTDVNNPDGDNNNPIGPTPIDPRDPPTVNNPSNDVIDVEFRVTGTATNVNIKYISSVEGTVFVTSVIPWIAKVSTTEDNIFLSLQAESLGVGLTEEILQAQIIVNGKLFRESTIEGFAPTASVSGTYTNTESDSDSITVTN